MRLLALRTLTNVVMRNGIINKLSWRYAGKTVGAHFFFRHRHSWH